MTKRYDTAQTPYQRLLALDMLSEPGKERLGSHYEQLDPLALLEEIQCLQDRFWQHIWKPGAEPMEAPAKTTSSCESKAIAEEKSTVDLESNVHSAASPSSPRLYRRTKEEGVAYTWRTRCDPFEQVS